MTSRYRLPAIDALGRGITNVRANAELVIVQFVSSLFIAISILAPIAMFLSEVGVPWSIFFEDDPAKVQEAFAGMDFDPAAALGMVGVGLVLLLVGGTVLFLFYCWAQAGTLAVLSAADAQAPVTRSAPVDVFRTFSWRGFFSWSFRYGWPFFWLNNLYLIFFTLPLLLLALPLAWLGKSFDAENVAASCLLACGLSIPVLFLFFALWLALQLSGAVMVVEDAGVVRSLKRGLALTGRRLGGLLLLVLLMIVASIAVGAFGLFAELGLGLVMREASALKFGITAGLEIFKFLLSTTFALIFSSSVIALVRGEARADAVGTTPSPVAGSAPA